MSNQPVPSSPAVLSAWTRALLALLIIFSGAATAYLGHKLMQMSIRYFVAVILGLGFLAVCAIFIRRLSDMLLFLLVLSIPLFTFEKTLMLTDTWVDFGTPGFSIGLLDLLLFGLYSVWFWKIAITRSQPLPRLTAMDGFVFAYLLANVASLVDTASFSYTTFEIYRVMKYGLAYFYVAHQLQRAHLRGIVLGLMCALVFESALGTFQFKTHKLVGIARTKGAFTAELDTQYEVPEFEGHRRAEGTTMDSHALGAYLALLLPFPLCLALAPWLRPRDRLLSAAIFCAGLPGLVATFSRGGWGGFAFAVATILIVYSLFWHEHRALRVFVILAMLAAPMGLLGGGALLGKRIFRAPSEIMSARWDTIVTGYEIWKQNILTGRGANAYFHAQRDLGKIYDLTNDKPAHNILAYLVAQMGLVGVLTYLALGIYLAWKCLVLIRWKDSQLSPLALAILSGMVAVQADGIVDFMAFTNQVYFMKFLSCGLVAGMLALRDPVPAAQFEDVDDWQRYALAKAAN